MMVPSTPAMKAFCRQLPASDQYEQAGVRYNAGDRAGAARLVTTAAQAGNAEAQGKLASMYGEGDSVGRDFKAATYWYSRAAAQGDPESQVELGYSYEEGEDVPENWDVAFRLWQASASQGWMRGEFALGRAYQFGIGISQDRGQAIAWFQRAGAHGHGQGAYFAKWLSDYSNNIGFRNDAEQNLVMQGKLRFALGAADPAGIAFHSSKDRTTWLRGLGAQTNVSEAASLWQLRKNDYDSCVRNSGANCRDPGPRPR